jgi:hypothetical protein
VLYQEARRFNILVNERTLATMQKLALRDHGWYCQQCGKKLVNLNCFDAETALPENPRYGDQVWGFRYPRRPTEGERSFPYVMLRVARDEGGRKELGNQMLTCADCVIKPANDSTEVLREEDHPRPPNPTATAAARHHRTHLPRLTAFLNR